MKHAAVFIDGAYLGQILKQHGSPRIDHNALATWAADGFTILRTYYYDCLPYQSSTPTKEESNRFAAKQKFFQALNRLPRFMIRQGRLSYRGVDDYGLPVFEQKRIDLQLGIDVTLLVAKQRIDLVVLVAGDSDLIPAVTLAKQEGVLVRLIHGPQKSYHFELWQEADERKEITADILQSMHMQ